jgi:hypothetical protein
MPRINRINFEQVAVSAPQDLFGLSPEAGKEIRILHRWLGATDTALVGAQSLALRERYLPGTVTPGSGGSIPAVAAPDPGDGIGAPMAWANATTKASTSGTAVTLWESGCDIWAGYDGDPVEPYAIGGGEAYVLELLSTVSGTVHLSGGVTYEEIGDAPSTVFFPGTPLAVYSTRKLVAGYSGNALQLKRSSDSALLDIGFLGTSLDLASAAAFLSGTVGKINKWYDQSGNANPLGQDGGNDLPQYQVFNGKVWLSFNGNQILKAADVPLTGDQTVASVNWTTMPNCFVVHDFNVSGWSFRENDTALKQVSYFSGSGVTVATTASNAWAACPSRLMVTRASGAVTIYVNGVSGATGTGSNTAAGNGLSVGGHVGAPQYTGLMSEIVIYASALSSGDRAFVDANQVSYWGDLGLETPYQGASWVTTGHADSVGLGNVLQFERTAAWTGFAAIQSWSFSGSVHTIFANVPAGSAAPGYLLTIDDLGRLNLRLSHDNSINAYILVRGAANVLDMNKHFVAVSYDGSSAAAGVKIYVDGAPDTLTVLSDNLTLTMVDPSQSLVVGSQSGSTGVGFNGCIGHVQIDNVARSAGYIAACATSSSLPPVDANTVLCLLLTEGSGTTAHDTSASGFNGTLSSSGLWVP